MEGSLSSPSSSSSISEQSVLTSMTTTLQTVLETMRKMDRKMTEASALGREREGIKCATKKQERENFSIKGSTWEVRQNSSKHCF